MINTMDDAVVALAEQAHDVTRDGNQAKRQRRNQVVDTFGVEMSRFGDENTPATFYISVSPDLIYYERFEFKIIISPFVMPVAGGGSTVPTSLDIIGDDIVPNPHNHALSPGVTVSPSSLTDASILIDGIDITDLLKNLHPYPWINGEGIYPGAGTANYDILLVAQYLPAWQRGAILKPGYKKVEFVPNGTCNVTFVLYLKYSHTNR